jgi:Phosphodiester glycosidase/FlgD Ig-like domain
LVRRVALVCLIFAALAVSATGQAPVQQLLPGVTFQQEVRFTAQGPVVIDVITAPRPTGVYSLVPELARDTVSGGLEPVTGIEADAAESSAGPLVGINGDSFTSKGYPTGIVLENGTMEHGALSTRSSIGFDAAGTMHVKRVAFVGTWKGSGQRRPLNGLNQIPTAGQVALFTPAWGASTPSVANSTEVVLEPFPAAAPNTDLTAPVTTQASGGGTPIPQDGAVLMVKSSSGTTAPLQTEAPVGQSVTVRMILPSDWATVTNAIGGGPQLVTNGKPVFHTGEDFDASALATRDARAAVGQLANGDVVLVAVDGDQPGYSAGMSIFDLAQTMVSLGAVTAAAVDSGGSVTAASGGRLLNRPRIAGGRPVKDALLIEYAGVYAPPPSVALLDRDTVAAGEQLSYTILRPSAVNASVVGPDGVATVLDSGMKAPGTYPFVFSAVNGEGTWHWKVTAVDDLGRSSSVDQTFAFDLTLSGLIVPRSTTRASGLTARFQLSRPASVTLQIETPGGTVVRALPPLAEQAGSGTATWDGTLDGVTKAPPGSYVARVTATSSVGTMDLTAPFTVRG